MGSVFFLVQTCPARKARMGDEMDEMDEMGDMFL
jgi:hypothetical protein